LRSQATRSLSALTIEHSVWEHGQTLLADPEVWRQQYEQGRGDPAIDVRAAHERARLERKLAALEREKTCLLDAYQAEVITLPELAERRERLTEQGQQLRARVQEIEQQRRDRAAELRLLEGVEAFGARMRDAMVAPAFEVKQKVLQWVVQRIVVEDHRIIIEHVVPSGLLRLQPEYPVAANPTPQLSINNAYSLCKNYNLYFSSYCSHNLESCTVGFRQGAGVVAESAW
jgi:site-specific DNA recombinase